MPTEFFEKELIPLFNYTSEFIENEEGLESAFSEATSQNLGMTSGVFILNKFGQFLLTKRSESDSLNPGLWDFPNGRVNSGESPQKAAIRELKEEAGVEIDNLFFLHTLNFT